MTSVGAVVSGLVSLAVLGLMLVGGLALLYGGLQRSVEAWHLGWADVEDVGSIPSSGRAMVRGTVELADDGAVSAPLTGRDVACAVCKIQKRRSTGQGTAFWKTVERRDAGTTFAVTDGIGTVTVDPTDAEIHAGDAHTTYREVESAAAAPERVRDLVAGIDSLDEVPAGDGVRYVEEFVRPDDEVLVYGSVASRDARTAFDGAGPLTIATTSERDLLLSELRGALVYVGLGVALASPPGLFVVFFLLPRLL